MNIPKCVSFNQNMIDVECLTPTSFNTLSINEVFETIVHPEFCFIGTLPSDAYRPYIFNMYKICLRYSRYYAFIINTKPHSHTGEHWVAVFIDKSANTVDYFDSYGKEPTKDIMQTILYILKKLKINQYSFNINYLKHQTDKSQCGKYAMSFIIMRLKNYPFTFFTASTIKFYNKVDLKKLK